MLSAARRRPLVGVSLKMYFSHRRARDWFAEVADVAARHSAVAGGDVGLFVMPGYLQLLPAREAFAGTRVQLGAQDLAAADGGAFTGEVSGAELAEIGVRLAEVGHAERRRLFGEDDATVAAKTAAALRNGLVPVLCVGEERAGSTRAAGAEVRRQLHAALDEAPPGAIVVAYEPVWAIGASGPAPIGRIRAVASELRSALDAMPGRAGSAVLYGGSAGPGMLGELGDAVDGLFLGRFAHEPDALRLVLDEAAALAAARA
ncbi:MAG: triose-phosphate isomerase [Protaetiibacter sp.]